MKNVATGTDNYSIMKKIINTSKAPAPIGPYNQAIFAGNTLYVSGQIALDPESGDLKTGDLETETLQVLENLKAIITEAGLTLDNIVKTSIFISDMNNFGKINEVYSRYFDSENAPARETVEVANLPKFVNVEISAIAVKF